MDYGQNPENFILHESDPVEKQKAVNVETLAEKEDDNAKRFWDQSKLVKGKPKLNQSPSGVKSGGRKRCEFSSQCFPQFQPKQLSRANYNELLDDQNS